MAEIYMGTGRRKTSVARVYLKPGTGKITINDQEYNDLNDYFENKIWTLHAVEPLRTVGLEGSFDLFIRVEGGGKSGQAGAVRLGITRALVAYNPDLRPILREKVILPGIRGWSKGKSTDSRKREGHLSSPNVNISINISMVTVFEPDLECLARLGELLKIKVQVAFTICAFVYSSFKSLKNFSSTWEVVE